ncbi:hypothetical protein WJX81_005635 [Elliptochloris bilobata]|uniref:Cyclin-like domain-containing protein n=1 Tax=Elliptochloris bilobata TaxID=381761 RepID=A0AAW1QW38_9CHLO
MIYTNIDNFYVTKEELDNSPSHRAGVEPEVVTQLRTYGCELIQEGGCLLKLPQVVMATGQVLFHRFYCKQSMTEYDVKDVATTCCWLASKLEETKRRVRDVLAVFHRIYRRREGRSLEPLDIYSKYYETLKAELIRVERIMLRSFGFIVHVEHPHKLVLNHLHLLGGGNLLMQEAWSLANDSLRTTLCVRFKSEAVACGIIFMAARRLQIPLPEDPPWWELHNVSWGEVVEVASEVYALYQRPKATYEPVGKPAGAPSPGAGQWQCRARRRQRGAGGGAHAKVGSLRVGSRGTDDHSPLRAGERQRDIGRSSARGSAGDERKAPRHTPIPPFRRN